MGWGGTIRRPGYQASILEANSLAEMRVREGDVGRSRNFGLRFWLPTSFGIFGFAYFGESLGVGSGIWIGSAGKGCGQEWDFGVAVIRSPCTYVFI